MEYRVHGVIKFHPGIQFKLDKTLEVSSPSGAQITLNPTDGSELAVGITLQANTDADAEEIAEIELERISNHLSYFKNIPISESKIEQVAQIAPRAPKSITRIKRVTAKACISVPIGFRPKDVEELRNHLVKGYNLCGEGIRFEEVVSLWKQAISTRSPELKYLLLYRLMESLFEEDSRTKRITNWIYCKDPSAEPKYRPFRGKNKITVYTYIRNRIHTKGELFPSGKIKGLLPKFQNLVRTAIKERCGISCAQ